MVLVPQWLRPGTPRSLGNHEARIRALERASGADKDDYVFVVEVVPSDGSTQFRFDDLPQDARHLVIFLNAGGAAMGLTVNGDNGADYTYLTDTLEDNAGVVTSTGTSNRDETSIQLDALANDGDFQGRAVITIPYYRRLSIGGESASIDRSLEIEAWQHWENPITPTSIYRHAKIAAFWNDPAFTGDGAHAITSILLNAGAGITGRASLYKIR